MTIFLLFQHNSNPQTGNIGLESVLFVPHVDLFPQEQELVTDPHRITSEVSSRLGSIDRPHYRIMRKGSRYNILGPEGRVFVKYKSASSVGPRWEELTHTPWPYVSSAYERGTRLWELGLIDRAQVGALKIMVGAAEPSESSNDAPSDNADAAAPVMADWKPIVSPLACFALPAPRLNLDEHNRVMDALRRDPTLLFTPRAQQALRDEVLYHRPNARWARHLLALLKRYSRQAQRRRPAPVDAVTITAKHVAWQAQQINMAAIASVSC